jgi:hypothetical protein
MYDFSNGNFKKIVSSKTYDSPKTTGECGMFLNILVGC